MCEAHAGVVTAVLVGALMAAYLRSLSLHSCLVSCPLGDTHSFCQRSGLQLEDQHDGAMNRIVVALFVLSALTAISQASSSCDVVEEETDGSQGGARQKLGETILRKLLQQPIDCAAACDVRCSKASRQSYCLRFCNICCSKCNCVPPGTSGNKETCPCYANMKNSKGTSKCP